MSLRCGNVFLLFNLFLWAGILHCPGSYVDQISLKFGISSTQACCVLRSPGKSPHLPLKVSDNSCCLHDKFFLWLYFQYIHLLTDADSRHPFLRLMTGLFTILAGLLSWILHLRSIARRFWCPLLQGVQLLLQRHSNSLCSFTRVTDSPN